MREIEYRAWLKKEKKIVDVREINFASQQISFETDDDILYAFFDEIELLEYTGLKDKNDVKIFEGDIVKDDKERVFVIEYKFGGFNIVPIDYYNDEFSWNPLGDMQTAGWLNESAEIIGNIWEHEYLLGE